jgi:hypothetical protein
MGETYDHLLDSHVSQAPTPPDPDQQDNDKGEGTTVHGCKTSA